MFSCSHALIVFGGLQGIDAAIEADEKLKANNSEQIFSHICESAEYSDYGSRTIRLEVKFKLFVLNKQKIMLVTINFT